VTRRLTAAMHGRMTVKLPRIHSLGRHKIHARYLGSTYVAPATGRKLILRVVASRG
jgi:hypothetical protein